MDDLFTPDNESIDAARRWYVDHIGYDPFAEGETYASVLQTKAEWLAASGADVTEVLEAEYEAYLASHPDFPQTDAESAALLLSGDASRPAEYLVWVSDFIRRWEVAHA